MKPFIYLQQLSTETFKAHTSVSLNIHKLYLRGSSDSHSIFFLVRILLFY